MLPSEIGVGRGYVGHTFMVTAHYSQPVSPDVAYKFVIKIPNTTVDWVAVFPGEPDLINWFNGLYVTENTFFEVLRDRCPINLPKGFGSGGVLPKDTTTGMGKFVSATATSFRLLFLKRRLLAKWVMMEDVGGSEGVLEYTQVDGCPNADHAEQVVRTAATNHGAWWNQPFVGDEVQGLMGYAETTFLYPLIQGILKDRWGELKRLVSDPSQGDRWSDMPMEAEVVDAFGEHGPTCTYSLAALSHRCPAVLQTCSWRVTTA